jgi:hypothetical protein
MTAQEALEQIGRDLAALKWSPCGSTSKLSLTGRHGSSDSSQAPKDYGSALIEAEGLLIRCATVIHQRTLGAIEPGENAKGEIKAAVRKAILSEPNATPKELAYTYNVHEDTVRRIRREAKQSDEQRDSYSVPPALALTPERRAKLAAEYEAEQERQTA